MREEQKVWQAMRDASASIYPLAQDMMGPLFEEHYTEQRYYFPTLIASGLAPQSLTLDKYCKRNPYANPNGIESLLSAAANDGYLTQDDNGHTLTEKGDNAINATNAAFYKRINQLNQFPADKLNELTGLLGKLVDACKKADLVNDNLCINISFNGHPTVGAGSLAQTDQQIDDLNAFRDDSHISAWTPTSVNRHTWETFSFVWNGEANTVEKLVERLPFRNYTAEDYTKTLADLTQRGWIEPGDDGYKVTVEGKRIREAAEDKTNQNFFDPWKVLSNEELTRLGELLNELKETNTRIAEENKT